MSDVITNILNLIQGSFPLEPEPFKAVGKAVGLTEAETIEAIAGLKRDKKLREISAIYDTKALGYDSSLVAFSAPDGAIDRAAEFVNTHPGVSHNYERPSKFNMWFTLAVPPDSAAGLDRTVSVMAEKTGIREYAILRAKRVFKIEVRFDFEGGAPSGAEKPKDEASRQAPVALMATPKDPLTAREKEIIKIAQGDIPLVSRPFAGQASSLGMTEEELVGKLKEFCERGVMRRFAAILFHRNVGFKANGMAAWRVPEAEVERVGKAFGAFKGVSHCYERTTNEFWTHNVFTMIHGKSREEVEDFVAQMARENGEFDRMIFFSTREFKKKRIKYFSDDFYAWEAEHVSAPTAAMAAK